MCSICEGGPFVGDYVESLRQTGAGYKKIWRALKDSGYDFPRDGVMEHLSHCVDRNVMSAIQEAVDIGVEVPEGYFEAHGVPSLPEGLKLKAATIEERGPDGQKHWIRVVPEAGEEERVEVRQAQPVNLVTPPFTVFNHLPHSHWRTWICTPDAQIGYWRDHRDNFHTIHDERCLDLAFQIASAIAQDEGLHGWLDVGDFADAAAFSRYNPTSIDTHVHCLNKTWQRGAEEFARRRSVVGPEGELVVLSGNHDCLDEQSRIVTRDGFLSIDEYAGQEVLTVDDEKQARWVTPTAIIRKPYEGDLYRIKGKNVDALMTPEHRVVGLKINQNRDGQHEWFERRAQDQGGFLAVTAGKGHSVQSSYSEWEIRLTAWCLTDSYYEWRSGKWKFYQRESKKFRPEQLLEGIEHSVKARDRDIREICGKVLKKHPEIGYEFTVNDIAINKRLRTLVPDKNSLPDWVWRLSEKEVDLLVREWVFTDGSLKADGPNCLMIYCSRTLLRRQLMVLMAANGYRVSEVEYRPGHWRLNATKTLTSKVSKEKRRKTPTFSIERYDGEVWCLEVPFERFFIERNGKVSLTGNCRIQTKANQEQPYLVGMRRAGDPDDEHPVMTVPYLMRARDYGVEWVPSWPTAYRRLNSNLVAFHSPAYGSKALDTARKIAARVHASVIFGHTHRRESLAENVETSKGNRTMEVWSDGTLARTDGSLPSQRNTFDTNGDRLLVGNLPNENWGMLSEAMHQGLSVIHVETEGRERFSVERVAIWDGWAQCRGQTFESSVDKEGAT